RLRLAGRPVEAMARIDAAAPDIRAARGMLLDGSGGAAAIWGVQAGITALLAGQLPTARGFLLPAATAHRPDRYPFIRREAAAKLALVYALGGSLDEAERWNE